jgi:DNA-binding response OmpR family regulator
MPTILVASDADHVRDAVQVALVRPGYRVVHATRGQDVTPFVAADAPDLVILDMQIANMGGFATANDLRLEESGGRLPHVPILLLLDRQADTFLGDRVEVDAMLVKPFDPGTLRRTVKTLLDAADAVDIGADAGASGA